MLFLCFALCSTPAQQPQEVLPHITDTMHRQYKKSPGFLTGAQSILGCHRRGGTKPDVDPFGVHTGCQHH